MASVNGESSTLPVKQRGAVEEIISKRLKTLTKKITRIKSYNTATLNADQQAAIASLPPLEAVARELEELIKPGGPIETTELAQAGHVRELKDEMLAQQEEVAGARVREAKEEIATRLSAFLQVHESLGREGAREKIGSEEVMRIKGIYQDLKSGDVSALDRLTEFNVSQHTPYTPSEGTSDGASDISYQIDQTPPQEYTSTQHTPGSYPINFLQQDEVVEWETPKTVDWSDEVDDGGLIFGDSGDKGLVFGQKEEEVPMVQERKEEIPILAPIIPIQTSVDSTQDTATTSQDTATTSQDTATTSQPSATSDKRQKKRGPNKPKARDPATANQPIPPSTERPSTERKKTQGPRPPKVSSGLPPKPQDDGFEQVVRKQATRGRGGARGGGVSRGRGRGRGGAVNGAVADAGK